MVKRSKADGNYSFCSEGAITISFPSKSSGIRAVKVQPLNPSCSKFIPELAMPRSSKVTTLCNGRREVWTDYEEAKAYFLELMMSTDGEKHDRAECVYIQLMHGLDECSDEDE